MIIDIEIEYPTKEAVEARFESHESGARQETGMINYWNLFSRR